MLYQYVHSTERDVKQRSKEKLVFRMLQVCMCVAQTRELLNRPRYVLLSCTL